jgi:uncharacterized SAM-binding protein YcdF (DUF218 family)
MKQNNLLIKNYTGNKSPKKRARWKRRVLIFLGAFFILIFTLYIFRYPIMRGMAGFLVYEDAPQTCDVVIVLGGGGPIRAERAVELMKDGYANRVMVTLPKETNPAAIDSNLINMESLELQSVFYMNGVAVENVFWSDEPFYSTYSEARYIRQWMKDREYEKAIVVTGLFQSRRAKWTLDHFMDESGITIWVVPAEGKHVSKDNWWTDVEGIITVENEIIKNVYYTFKIMLSNAGNE